MVTRLFRLTTPFLNRGFLRAFFRDIAHGVITTKSAAGEAGKKYSVAAYILETVGVSDNFAEKIKPNDVEGVVPLCPTLRVCPCR